MGVVIVVLGLLGGAVGYATGFGWGGLVRALVIAVVMSVGSWFAGDALVMATSGAREVDRAHPPEPFGQRSTSWRRCAWRGPATPAAVGHRRLGAERVRHRA